MPAIIYKNDQGQRVPSVTSIISQWGISKQPLMYWAWKQGEKGIPLSEKPEADVGTIAHMMIDADVKGKPLDLSKFKIELIEQARPCFNNFIEWRDSHKFKAVETEISLISEQYQYGGTIDCIAQIDGKLSICDWKTSKEIYEDYLVQIASYGQLWLENFPDHTLEGGYHILRTGKEIAMFAHSWYGEFPKGWEAFLHLRELYDLSKEIKKLK